MKNIKTTSIILIMAVIIFGCKKKEEAPVETPSPTTTTGSSPAHVTIMTAKVNNQNWSVYSNQFGPLISLDKSGTTREIGGQNANNTPYTVVKLNFNCQTGVFPLTIAGVFSAKIIDNNIIYTSKTGTINVTSFDTSKVKSQYLDKLKCTFSFKTDTINNQSFNVTDGVIDFEK